MGRKTRGRPEPEMTIPQSVGEVIQNHVVLESEMATRTKLTKALAVKSVDALLKIITAAIAKNDNVTLSGFGTFRAVKRAARRGRNPRTGEAMNIAAVKVPKFSAGAALKAVVAGRQGKKAVFERP